jgi:SAM-dependent methyltransferase
MRVADLIERNPPLLHLGNEHPARQAMIDQTARTIGPAECADGERHGPGDYPLDIAAHGVIPVIADHVGHTGVVVANINFGPGTPDDDELRLCGDVSDGRRAVELGISPWYNSIGFARAGAKSIAVDTDTARIAETRTRAAADELSVQCLETDLADLGDIASTSCEVVLAAHTIGDVDDLGRLLRQVHRILKPSMPLVISMPHPFAGVDAEHPYGADERTIGSWFTALNRSNFRVDHVIELGASASHPTPTTLVLRARKEGS